MPKCQDFFADPELPVLFFPARKIFRTKIRRPQNADGGCFFSVSIVRQRTGCLQKHQIDDEHDRSDDERRDRKSLSLSVSPICARKSYAAEYPAEKRADKRTHKPRDRDAVALRLRRLRLLRILRGLIIIGRNLLRLLSVLVLPVLILPVLSRRLSVRCALCARLPYGRPVEQLFVLSGVRLRRLRRLLRRVRAGHSWHHFPTLSRNICKTSFSHPFKNYAFPHFLSL